MRCPEVEARIDALVDGELDVLSRWRVQWHLRRCPQCRAEQAAALHQREQAQRWRTGTAPSELRDRIAAALHAAQPSVPASLSAKESSSQSDFALWTGRRDARPRRVSPMLKMAGFAAVTLIIVTILLTRVTPLPSLAQIHRTMQRARTIHWTLHLQPPDLTGNPMAAPATDAPKAVSRQFWMRTEPPALAMEDDRGKYQLLRALNPGSIGVTTGGPGPISDGTADEALDLGLIFSPEMLKRAGVSDSPPNGEPAWTTDQVTLGNRRLIRYTRLVVKPNAPSSQNPMSFEVQRHQVILVDPTTERIFQVEDSMSIRFGESMTIPGPTMLMQDFQYDLPAPPGIFQSPSHPPHQP
ncbi:MAG TPA: zf-HC2 domain-containing protein [Chthonomonadaceae bacterium]|nr:zf-HC2 domain-containing protein [Chthonomonadaceae bacterium]